MIETGGPSRGPFAAGQSGAMTGDLEGDGNMNEYFSPAHPKFGLGRWVGGLLCMLAIPTVGLSDELPVLERLGEQFGHEIRPIMNQFCMKCHAADVQEGTLDLEQFASLADVRRSTKTWVKVAEMLDNGEMPPKKAPQPMPEHRQRLRSWVASYLKAEALASAGDPGPVVLRRLGNAEYTYSLLDLTGIDLQPAREFPVDGAAGEGFTNTGNALVMSPALLSKYLDAGKKIADHAVLLPDGIRFSPGATRRDWTDELLGRIRSFYGRFTDAGGSSQVNLQGIVFGTNEGGRLPLEKYLTATIAGREALASGARSIADVARDRGLNPKYLATLWTALNGGERSSILDVVRDRWRQSSPDQAAALASEIGQWQKSLWRFTSVGQIGKVGGPKAWMEPVTPIAARQELRTNMPGPTGGEVVLTLVAGDAGDGHENDFVVWERPRVVTPGRPDLLLRDVRDVAHRLAGLRKRAFSSAADCLAAAAEASAAKGRVEAVALAKRHGVEPAILAAWLDYLGIDTDGAAVKINMPLSGKVMNASGYAFVNGWSIGDLPSLLANSSDQHVRIPGNLKPHSVAVHPSPSLKVAAGWMSPVTGVLRIEGRVQHAHPECGNGVTWSLELRRGAVRQRLAAGVAQGAKEVTVGPVTEIAVRRGDLVSLLIGPRDGNHACDLTAVDLTLAGDGLEWNLAREVSPDVLLGNPHADARGNPGVWHFYTEPDKEGAVERVIPAGSILARWQKAATADDRQRLAHDLQTLLKSGPPAAKDSPDGLLYRQLSSLRGPLVGAVRLEAPGAGSANAIVNSSESAVGLDPALFGKHPGGTAIDNASLCVRRPAPSRFACLPTWSRAVNS